MDYDSPHPARIPRIPITLTGAFGVPVVSVAFRLGGMTGLPAASLADLVTHDAGCSELVRIARHGVQASAERELRCLRRALRGTPAGILALTPSTLLSPAARAMVLARSVLVHVSARLDWCLDRLRDELAERPTLHSPWLERDHLCDATLQALWDERREGYEASVLGVDATGRSPGSVALELAKLLELLDEPGA